MLSSWLIERVILSAGAALVSITFLYGLIFFIDGIKKIFMRKHALTTLLFSLFFILTAISRVLYTIHDLYELTRGTYWCAGLVFNMLALDALVFLCEYGLKKTKYIFTAIGIVITGLVGFIYEVILFASSLLLIVMIMFIYLIKEVHGAAREYTVTLLVGYSLYGGAVIVGAQFFREIIDLDLLVLYGVMFLGILIIAYAMFHFPVMEEIRWNEVIENVYVITETGIPLFYYNKQGVEFTEVLRKSGLIAATHNLAESLRTATTQKVDYIQFVNTILIFDAREVAVKTGNREENIFIIAGIETSERLLAVYSKIHELMNECVNVVKGIDLADPAVSGKTQQSIGKIFEELFEIKTSS